MAKPLISVVLGTYNGEKYLAPQLESILHQSYQPMELIISDDASSDNTRSILRKFESQPGIHIYYQQQNLGLSGNYSFAASKAKGEMVAFSDQDDIWKTDKLERLAANLNGTPLIYSDSILISETGENLNRKLSDIKKMYSGHDSRGYFLYSCVWGHGMMVTRDLLQKSLPIPTEVHHDIWIAYQAFLNGGIKYLDEPLTWYRQYYKNGSNGIKLRNGEAIMKKYYEYKKKLDWLELMKKFERPEYQGFYSKLHELYAQKEKGGYVFPLVPFMLKHRKAIFQLSKKGFASHFVEIVKQARGTKV